MEELCVADGLAELRSAYPAHRSSVGLGGVGLGSAGLGSIGPK